MNYIDVYNCLKKNNINEYYTTWYHDDPMEEFVRNMSRNIWYSDGRNEIEVKEEKKNGRTESELCSSSQRLDDGCIYW